MKLFVTLSLSLFIAACGGKSSGGGTTAAAGPTCADAASNVSSVMHAQMPELPDDVVAKVTETATTACTEDAWSAEAIKCYAEATSSEGGAACDGMLSDEQQQSLASRMAPLFENGGAVEGGEGGEGEGGEAEGGEE